ncbi:uncharacterized protein LOC115629225 isoform X2 [Scaptodrosophila lebanonensis]|uniref:Uncharacterized protein LOC115629225 isoform X2 n=1 Tax=Drosophila lebanonensis TaxID=7225 RepID=A0A6J2U2Y7_DROLE|nr:uncharacterized protein LOC115629225 isoform X2 [Scaptodrosophila lebanonensis]
MGNKGSKIGAYARNDRWLQINTLDMLRASNEMQQMTKKLHSVSKDYGELCMCWRQALSRAMEHLKHGRLSSVKMVKATTGVPSDTHMATTDQCLNEVGTNIGLNLKQPLKLRCCKCWFPLLEEIPCTAESSTKHPNNAPLGACKNGKHEGALERDVSITWEPSWTFQSSITNTECQKSLSSIGKQLVDCVARMQTTVDDDNPTYTSKETRRPSSFDKALSYRCFLKSLRQYEEMLSFMYRRTHLVEQACDISYLMFIVHDLIEECEKTFSEDALTQRSEKYVVSELFGASARQDGWDDIFSSAVNETNMHKISSENFIDDSVPGSCTADEKPDIADNEEEPDFEKTTDLPSEAGVKGVPFVNVDIEPNAADTARWTTSLKGFAKFAASAVKKNTNILRKFQYFSLYSGQEKSNQEPLNSVEGAEESDDQPDANINSARDCCSLRPIMTEPTVMRWPRSSRLETALETARHVTAILFLFCLLLVNIFFEEERCVDMRNCMRNRR